MASLFPAFRRFEPPAGPPAGPPEAPAVDLIDVQPSAPTVTPGSAPDSPRPTICPATTAATATEARSAPLEARAAAAATDARPESPPGSEPTPEATSAAQTLPVHEVGRTMLQAFMPVCHACLSSVYLERRYSDGSEALTCVCCRAVVDGEPKPGLAAERRAKREAERNRLSGRFAEDGN